MSELDELPESFEPTGEKVQVFVSYPEARNDLRATFVDAVFDPALRTIADVWTDDDIAPGDDWEAKILAQLRGADIILLLLTPEFLASRFITEVEGPEALARADRAKVLAVLLEDCDYAACGYGALELLADDGKPLRSSANAKKALDAIRLQIKYEAYACFEAKNHAIVRTPGAWWDEPDSLLISDHELDAEPVATTRAFLGWLAIGAACGAGISFGLLQHLGSERWWALLLTAVVTGTLCSIAAWTMRLLEMPAKEREWPAIQEMLFLAVPVGVAAGLLYGVVLVALLLAVEVIPRQPGMIAISAFTGAMLFGTIHDKTREKRLAVYRDLVRAGRRPEGGWRIETLPAELERMRDLAFERRMENLRESWLRHGPPEPEPAPESESAVVPEEDFDEVRRRYEEAREAGARPRTLLALVHNDDEAAWRELETVLRSEGVGDLCDIRECRIDAEDCVAMARDADIVVPLLSPSFEASPLAAAIAHALSSGDVEMYAVRLDDIDWGKSSFAERQLLPQHLPARRWPVIELAWQNVARNLVRRISQRPFSWPYGFPPLTTHAWNADLDAAWSWMTAQTLLGFVSGLIVWAAGREWAAWQASLAMTILGLAGALRALYSEESTTRNMEEDFVPGRYAREAVVLAVLRRFPAVALTAAILPVLFLLSVAVSPPAPTRALITFADVGVVGGAAFGVLGYLASRRRRPVVLLHRKPPALLDTWVTIRGGRLIARGGAMNRRDEARGAIGEIPNRAPKAVAGVDRKLGMSIPGLVLFSVEIAVATIISWKLFEIFLGGRSPRMPALPFAAWLMLICEGWLVSTYDAIATWVSELRHPARLSLWRSLRWAWKMRFRRQVFRPFYVWLLILAVFNGIAWAFSAPLALPLLSTILVAAVTAAMATAYRHLESS